MNRRLFLAAALACLPALSPGAAARQIGPPGGARTNNPKDRMVEDNLRSTEIERVRRAAERRDARPAAEREFPAIKEDFERMQLVNNALQEGAAGRVDYGRVAEGAAEIRKRAARLSARLFPPPAGKRPPAQGAGAAERAGDLKSLLAELDRAILGFVSNPMFGDTRVVNVPDSTEARRDLERVVRLSGRVREVADRLKKQSK